MPDLPDVFFHTQGPIPPDAEHLYIRRRADDELERIIEQREYAVVIGPRLCGKSSLLLRQWARLHESPDILPLYVALGQLRRFAPDQWIGGLYQHLVRQSDGVLDPTPVTRTPEITDRLLDALNATLADPTLVIMLDQVEAAPEDVILPWFAQVREMYINRWLQPDLRRIVFVLAGRFVPDDLIRDPDMSPFRVAGSVYVEDADLEGVARMVALLGTARRQVASNVPARVYEWTEGDIYLTHKLCAGLAHDIPEGTVMLADVDRGARRHLYEDDLFRRMWNRVQTDNDLAGLIDTLLEHRAPMRFTLLQRPIMNAWLEGAIKRDSAGYCALHSLVHESVFYALQHTRTGQPRAPRAMNAIEEHTVLQARYRLDHLIHPGLTSYVFRATDLHTGDQVAVKQLMVTRQLNEMAWHRFQREADALKHLRHPNIVRLLDTFGERNYEYIVMEYVYGGALYDWLNREGRLPVRVALDIVIKVASALDHAHSQGIIHRDIKPSNTLMTPDHEPRLTDFGIARLNYHARVTLPHTVIGTLPYLSPEGIRGETTDPRGDIWSLGVMLYEMLAGTLPFVGRSDDVIAKAILENPPPDIRATRPDVPDSVIAVIAQMLAKPVGERLSSAAEVCNRLRAILASLPDDPPYSDLLD